MHRLETRLKRLEGEAAAAVASLWEPPRVAGKSRKQAIRDLLLWYRDMLELIPPGADLEPHWQRLARYEAEFAERWETDTECDHSTQILQDSDEVINPVNDSMDVRG